MATEWKIYNKFSGWHTLDDPEKIDDGANSDGENTTINNGDRISARNLGYEPFPLPTADLNTEPIHSLHTFRKRSGVNIMMRAWGANLQFFDTDLNAWVNIKGGYSGTPFGFADYDVNSDLRSYVYFGNGVEDYSRWNGAHALFASATVNTITKQGVDTWGALGFLNSGTRKVTINGIDYTYTGGENTTTLTGVTPDPTAVVINPGSAVIQTVETFPSGPKGNIYLNANNRLFVSGDPNNQQIVYFTKYGDPTDFTNINNLVTDTTATSAGLFNLGEGGGPVTDMALDEGSIYIFKKAIVYKATLSDSFYTLVPLKPFDSKSQTMGALGGTVFTGTNAVILVTPDNQILNLTRVDYIDYPQALPISHDILPTALSLDFTSAKGIVFNNKMFLSCRSSQSSPVNDLVLLYDLVRANWDSPITGWNVADWAIYNSGSGDVLYFSSSNSRNVYQVTGIPTDDIYDVKANYFTKQYDFGMASELKVCDEFFVEGRIAQNTSLNVTAYLDDNGFTQTFTGTIKGTDSDLLFGSQAVNSFGENSIGEQVFGSNPPIPKNKFRIYFAKDVREIPFYTIQLRFQSEGPNQQWEVLSYGFRVGKWSQPEDRKLYRKFN